MSFIKANNLTLGRSATASNNFTWRNLLDGILRLSRGNSEAPITDVMLVNADNSVEFPGGVVDPTTPQVLTSSRVLNTTYTNTDAFPREVYAAAILPNNGSAITAFVAGVEVDYAQGAAAAAIKYAVRFRVLPGENYSVNTAGSPTLSIWTERKV